MATEKVTDNKVQQNDEDSSEEEEEVKVEKTGYIEMRLKKKDRKAVYCLLIGGSFYYYKTNTDSEPKGSIDLQNHKIIYPFEKAKKKHAFGIAHTDKPDEMVFVGSCIGEGEVKDWVAALTANLVKERCDPPTSSSATTAKVKKTKGVIRRAQNKAAANVATSGLGKKVMKAIINEETMSLLNALKQIVKSASGSQKKAEELEKNIIKIAVKSFLLIENKTLKADDFLVVDKPIREAFELMVKVFNGKGRVKEDRIFAAIERVVEYLKKTEDIITTLLGPHTSSKNMMRIASVFGVLADSEFLKKAFMDDTLEVELDKLIDAMEYYTQFHYH